MSNYLDNRRKTEKTARRAGILAAAAVHVLFVACGTFSGLKYLYPPPDEQTFLLDFSEPEKEPARQAPAGRQPVSEEVDLSKPVELVRSSRAQEQGTKANLAREATVDDHGDVEKYEPPREKEINNRALFHAADNKTDKDTLAAQTARQVSEALRAGHASGNTDSGRTDGTPNAHVKGRSVDGVLPRPSYPVQEEGVVVVTIWVDNYGKVQKAQAGAEGTTVDNKSLWNEARKAAMGAHFNMSADAPALQEGTITYIFKLK